MTRKNRGNTRSGRSGQPEDSRNQSSGIPRRTLLAAGGLGLHGGVTWWLTRGKEAEQAAKQVADINETAKRLLGNVPITQRQTDETYKSLYEQVKAAKERADAAQKKLVILGADLHTSRNSLRLGYMLQDIAQRLGIHEGLEELDQHGLKMAEADIDDHRKVRDKNMGSKDLAPVIQNVSDKEKSLIKMMLLMAPFKRLEHSPGDLFNDKVENNVTMLMRQGVDLGIHFNAADPDHEQRIKLGKAGKIEELFNPKFEQSMVNEIVKVAAKDSCIGFFGAGHVPSLDKMLRQQCPNVEVLTLDLTAGASQVLSQAKSEEPIVIERMEQLRKFPSPGPVSAVHPHPIEAISMAMQASIKHREDSHELTAEQAKKIKDIAKSYLKAGIGR